MRSIVSGIVLAASVLVTAPSLAQDKVGIPICDEFLAKYETCARDKMPAEMRETIINSITQMRSTWKQALTSSPASKDPLEASCRQTFDSMKTSLSSSYGCSF